MVLCTLEQYEFELCRSIYTWIFSCASLAPMLIKGQTYLNVHANFSISAIKSFCLYYIQWWVFVTVCLCIFYVFVGDAVKMPLTSDPQLTGITQSDPLPCPPATSSVETCLWLPFMNSTPLQGPCDHWLFRLLWTPAFVCSDHKAPVFFSPTGAHRWSDQPNLRTDPL